MYPVRISEYEVFETIKKEYCDSFNYKDGEFFGLSYEESISKLEELGIVVCDQDKHSLFDAVFGVLGPSLNKIVYFKSERDFLIFLLRFQ